MSLSEKKKIVIERLKKKMKMKRLTSKYEYITEKIRVSEIATIQDKNGLDHIFIKSDENKQFSNFKNVWDKQNIDIESLEEGDLLEIVYVVKQYHGKSYNNFVKVRFVERPSLVEALDQLKSSQGEALSSDEITKLVDEIDM